MSRVAEPRCKHLRARALSIACGVDVGIGPTAGNMRVFS